MEISLPSPNVLVFGPIGGNGQKNLLSETKKTESAKALDTIMNPLITAIIPTYNRGYVVCEAIESVLQQTYPNIELIVVDDGSTDDTQEKLKKFGNSIRVVYQENCGPAAARNCGIRAGHGSIICFLDSDDLWLPTFVERQVSILLIGGPSVPCSLCNAITRSANGVETESFELAGLRPKSDAGLWLNALDVLLTRFVMCTQMMAIRREALERAGLFDSSLGYLEDYDIALRMSLEGPWGYIREPLVVYRQSTTGDSMSLRASSMKREMAEYMLRIRERVRIDMQYRCPPVRSRYVVGSVRKAKRDIWVAQAKAGETFAKARVAELYSVLEHYCQAIYRRSPLYPRMNVVSLP